MKLFKGLLIGFTLLAVAALGVGFMLPDRAQVERSTLIDAPPATVFIVLDGFRQFNRWSPWADLDPKTIYTYDGPPMGVGARTSWSSANANVGAGSQEILEVTPYSLIKLRLSFDGMDADTRVTYTLVPEGKATRLSWSYASSFEGNLIGRYFGLILDRMVGPDFDKGLGRLKALAESLPQDDFTSVQPELVQLEPQPIAYVSREMKADQADATIAEALTRINQFLQDSGRRQVDTPIIVTRALDAQTGVWKFDVGIPIDEVCTTPSEAEEPQCGKSYSGWALRAQSTGPSTTMEHSLSLLKIYQVVAGLDDNGPSWQQIQSPAVDVASDSPLQLFVPVK